VRRCRQEKLIDSIANVLPESAEVRTGAGRRPRTARASASSASSRYFLLGFGGDRSLRRRVRDLQHALDHGCPEDEELATLRTLGASAPPGSRSVVLEGLVLGVVASAVGQTRRPAREGLTALFRAVDLEMPQAAMVFQTRTAVVTMLTGTLVTLVASVWPAVRATRIAPISAVREGGMVVKRPSRRHWSSASSSQTFGVRPRHGTLGEGSTGGCSESASVRSGSSSGLRRRASARAAAGPRRRPACSTPRRRGRSPRPGERGAQPRPHGLTPLR
jgi:hypothetical protein